MMRFALGDTEFLDEVDRESQEFFSRFPAFADGSARDEAHAIADDLLSRGVRPGLVATLLHAWGEVAAVPPLARWQVDQILEEAAGELHAKGRRSAA